MGRSDQRHTGELKSLTSLRGVAAFAVVLQHFSATAQQYCTVTIPSLVPHGYVAVDFFFILSGFIMSYTYLDSFRAGGLRAFGPFLMKRVARVVPLNLAVLALIGVLGLASVSLTGGNIFFQSSRPAYDFLANALMLQGLGVGMNLNGPSWSISVEFAAYLLFPAFLAVMFGARWASWAAVAVSAGYLVAMGLTHPRLGLGGEGPPESLFRCFTEFTLGIAAYRMLQVPRLCAVLRRDGVTILLLLLACASLLARYDLPAVSLFPFIVVAYATNRGIAARIVQSRPAYVMGVISFSLYLLHDPFRPLALRVLQALYPQPVGPAVALTFAFLGACSVIPFAWLAYVTVERPGRTIVRALFGRRMAAPAGPS